MTVHSKKLAFISLLVAALSIGTATAANAGNFPGGRNATNVQGVTTSHLPKPQPKPQGGLIGGGGGGKGALCYDKAPGCHSPF